MSSLRRILSSRANGNKSQGPVTPEGKRRSSLNAVRHGLLADSVLLHCEDREAFDEIVRNHVQFFGPIDEFQFGMIEEMASAAWRLRRSWAIENQLFAESAGESNADDDLARLTSAFKNLSHTNELALLHRYETRLHRMYQRALQNLLLLKKVNTQFEPSPISGHFEPAPVCLPEPAGETPEVRVPESEPML